MTTKTKSRTRVSELYKTKSNFLKAADIKGRSPVVTISDYEIGTVGDEKREQVILSFEGKQKKLGLNKTNAERLWVLSGSEDPEDWIGAKIRLLVDPTVEFQGKKVDAIRISLEFWQPPPGKPHLQTTTATTTKNGARSQPQPPQEPEDSDDYPPEDYPTDDSQDDDELF